MEKEYAALEYKHLCENLLFYAKARYAIAVIFLTINGGLLVGWKSIDDPFFHFLFSYLGITVGFCAPWLDNRYSEYWRVFKTRAITLEKILGFDSYSNFPEPKERKLFRNISYRHISLRSARFWISWFYVFTSVAWFLIFNFEEGRPFLSFHLGFIEQSKYLDLLCEFRR